MSGVNIKRRIFSKDPAKRFGKWFKCSPDVWREVWRRYKVLDYTLDETYEYLRIIRKVPINKLRFTRWVKRTEIYILAKANKQPLVNISSTYFGKFQQFVEDEMSKNNGKKTRNEL